MSDTVGVQDILTAWTLLKSSNKMGAECQNPFIYQLILNSCNLPTAAVEGMLK